MSSSRLVKQTAHALAVRTPACTPVSTPACPPARTLGRSLRPDQQSSPTRALCPPTFVCGLLAGAVLRRRSSDAQSRASACARARDSTHARTVADVDTKATRWLKWDGQGWMAEMGIRTLRGTRRGGRRTCKNEIRNARDTVTRGRGYARIDVSNPARLYTRRLERPNLATRGPRNLSELGLAYF
eukprot:2160561-Pleurochrysis_carterae.AAC.1